MLAWHIALIVAGSLTCLAVISLLVVTIVWHIKNKKILKAQKKEKKLEAELDLPNDEGKTSLWGYKIETKAEWELYRNVRFAPSILSNNERQELTDLLEKEKQRKEKVREKYKLTLEENALATKYVSKYPQSVCSGAILISLVPVLLIAIIGWVGTINAQWNYRHYKEKGVYLESVIEAGKPLENIGMTQEILEYNEWLARKKTNKKTFGKCSFYYNIDLDELNYVRVPTTGE